MNKMCVGDHGGSTALSGARLARVLSVDDPRNMARVQVQILGSDQDAEAPVWARVATGFAGPNRGAFMLPDVDDEVLVVFAGGSARAPIVIGSLWNNATDLPENPPSSTVSRWSFTGKNGTRIAIDEENGDKIELETPDGRKIEISDRGGRIRLRTGGNTVTLNGQGVEISTSGTMTIDASMMSVSASVVNFECSMASFTGTVQCMQLVTPSVSAASYTPGVGNIW